MKEMILIRGLAFPYGRTRAIDDIVEYGEPGSFRNFVASGPRVEVRYLSHDPGARVLSPTSIIFDGPEGLFFEMRMPFDYGVAALCVSRRASASIYFSRREIVRGKRVGMDCEIVTRAEIDHITICDGDAAYGALAPVWRADAAAGIKDAPYEVRQANEAFVAARAAWRSQRAAEAWAKPSPAALANSDSVIRRLGSAAPASLRSMPRDLRAFALAGIPPSAIRRVRR